MQLDKPICKICEHPCHRGKDCPDCVNDVCFKCKCKDCED